MWFGVSSPLEGVNDSVAQEVKGCHASYNDSVFTPFNTSCTSNDGLTYTITIGLPIGSGDNGHPALSGIYGRVQASINGQLYEAKASAVIALHNTITGNSFYDRSLTVSMGEEIHLSVDLPTCCENSRDKVRWQHNGNWMNGWHNSSVYITNARVEDSGIYKLSYGKGTGEIMVWHVKVRGCPVSRYGPPECAGRCPTCHNGGLCDHVTGLCICPAGYIGINCHTVCASGTRYGRSCTKRCPGNNCQGHFICPPDPMPCSCAPGYYGLACSKRCTPGSYGPDCSIPCNCQDVFNPCDYRFGCSSRCDTYIFNIDRCKKKSIGRCPYGYYGTECHLTCHCNPHIRCVKSSGSCGRYPCADGWAGFACQEGMFKKI
ncbi:tyrosine-protein kinase receptor Tie-1-like [Anneissia japonica]|uniref:tyrosine-protein kinase receptor Tie-1-like n=1 Tax=Anneissia japonica TaxID=1529436 RepID=UPI0014258033|nr:tyrosine-protein kinase receptor Tie-1-like [Anneissia japonica]